MGKNWRTVYVCNCGKNIINGVGKWDSKFFLTEVCPECGESKNKFERLGVGYWKWMPKWNNWFDGKYVLKSKDK